MTPDQAAERIFSLVSEERLDFEAVITSVREKRDERIAEVERDLAAWRRNKRSVMDWSGAEVDYWLEAKALRRLAA